MRCLKQRLKSFKILLLIISELNQNNQTLTGKLNSLQQMDKGDGSMIDLIRRVARLEEVVFKD